MSLVLECSRPTHALVHPELVISRREKKARNATFPFLTENNPSVVFLGYPVPAVYTFPPACHMDSHALSKSIQTKETYAAVGVIAASALVFTLYASQLICQRAW